MSALTSPAASPRSSFHIQRPSYTTSPTTRASPRTPWVAPTASSSSSRRTFNAQLVPSPPPRKESHTTTSHVGRGSRFVDAGTQYSPEGYPPTAVPRQPSATIAKEPKSPGTDIGISSSRKRKDPETAQLQSSPEAMSTSSPSSSTVPTVPPPSQPEVRTNPDPESSPLEARSTLARSSTPKRSRHADQPVKRMPAASNYNSACPKDLGTLISTMLLELIRLNDRIPLRDGRLTRFHSRAPPGISVTDYLQRLIHHATLPPAILLSMVYYIDRLCQLYPAFTINSLTVHRFLITAATVAAKGLSDSFWTNPTYARIGGIPVSELKTLELEFLFKVQWKIVPKPEVLEEYYVSLVERTEGFELEKEDSVDEDKDDMMAENVT